MYYFLLSNCGFIHHRWQRPICHKKKPFRFEEGLLPCWVSANLKPSARPFPAVPTAAALYNKNHIKCPLTHWVHLMWPITPWNVKMSRCAVVVGSRLHKNKTDIWIHINDKYTHQSDFLKAPLYCVVSFRILVQTLNTHILKTSNTEHFNQC